MSKASSLDGRCRRFSTSVFFLMAAASMGTSPLAAANLYWDSDAGTAGVGGAGTWTSTSVTWATSSDGSDTAATPPGASDFAYFTGTSGAVTLSDPATIGGLVFTSHDYRLSGSPLTLAGDAVISVAYGDEAVIDSVLSGSAGLTKVGGGTLRLTNLGNDYTGVTTIANGTLQIAGAGALGGSSGAVLITERNGTPNSAATYGFGGGSLRLDALGGAMTFARDISAQGLGPVGGRSGALFSSGDVTLSGVITLNAGALEPVTYRSTRFISSNGLLTFSGSLVVNGTAGTHLGGLGGTNSGAVPGNFAVTGTLSGTGTLQKSGSGVLILAPSDASGFTGRVRVSSSAPVGQSSVLVTSAGVFGTANGDTSSAPVDLDGGVLEVRSDAGLAIGRNVYLRTASTLAFDHAPGSSALGGTTSFGKFTFERGQAATFTSRNGQGVTFSGTSYVNNTDNNSTITNGLSGELRFVGNLWNNTNTTARTLTVGGSGNTVVQGSVVASGATHALTKSGNGTLTITGVSSTYSGATNLQFGELAITDFRSLNNNTSAINIGSATNANVTLVVGNGIAPSSAGLITSKVVNLSGTTGGARIFANQSGSAPVVFNANFTASGAGSKTLILGGSSTAANLVAGAIVNNSSSNTTAVRKDGVGTWVLAGANTYTGATSLTEGVLRLRANAATSTVLPAAAGVTFTNNTSFAGATLEFEGLAGTATSQALGALGYSAGANTVRLVPGDGGSASLSFTNLSTGGGSSINFVGGDFSGNRFTISQVNGSAGSDGILTRSIFWNGSDYAYRQGGVLRAPVYGVDGGTVTSASALGAGHNEVTGSFATATASVQTVKFSGSHTLTVNGGATLTLSTGGVLVSGGNAAISGGTLALAGQVLVVRANLLSDTLEISSSVTGTGGLSKSGLGTLILSGPSTRTGQVNIDQGVLRLAPGGSLGGTATTVVRRGAVLDLNGVSTGASVGQLNNLGTVTNGSVTPAVITVGNGDANGVSYGLFQNGLGVLSLAKAGNGTLTLNGDSTYTGVTTIGGAGLVTVARLADGGAPSGIGASAADPANLVFNGTTGGLAFSGESLDLAPIVVGSFSASTDRLFTLAGTGATIASNVANGNALVWSATGDIAFGAVGPQALILAGSSTGDNVFRPRLTDSGVGADVTSLSKAGSGQWILAGSANAYSGPTTVTEGVLALGAAGALPAASPLALSPVSATANAVLQLDGVFDRPVASAAVAGAGTVTFGFSVASTSGGAGFAAHTLPLVVALGGVSSPAALTWGADGFIGTGGVQNLTLGSASALAPVDFRNPVDLAGAVRSVNVLDNVTTGADFATMSGVLSGAAGSGLRKIGTGVLRLSGDNTYAGVTEVSAGALAVHSLGSSLSPGGSSSVGLTTGAHLAAGAVTIGNGGTGGAVLQHLGPGETSDRRIRLNTSTGNVQIHADGTGPLVLTNVVNDMVAGTKRLYLRGSSTSHNRVASVLADFGAVGDRLNVQVDGSGVWILSAANTYTGDTVVGAGALGAGHDQAFGTGTLSLSGGNLFAYGGARTLANGVTMANNSTNGFMGDHGVTFTAPLAFNASANSITLNNGMLPGARLTFAGGVTADALTTSNRSWNFDGPGETLLQGAFTTVSVSGVSLVKTGDGVLLLGLDGAGSNFNQNGANVDLDRGVLRMTVSGAVPSGPGRGGLIFSPEAADSDLATFDLNGTAQAVNALTATSNGTVVIDNTSASAASLSFGAADSTVTFGAGPGSYTVTDSGAGALSLIKVGAGAAVIPAGVTLSYQGSTVVEGGSFSVSSPVNGTSALVVTGAGSSLSLAGGLVSPAAVTRVTVGGGASLSLLDGAGSAFSSLSTLEFGVSGGGLVTLGLNVGDGSAVGDNLGSDLLSLQAGGTLSLGAGSTIRLNLTDAGLNGNQTYAIVTSADGGLITGALGAGDWVLGAAPGGFTSVSLLVTDTQISLQTGNLITGDAYWAGASGLSWNAAASNWTTDKAGAVPAASIPGAGTDVRFSADTAPGGAFTSSLDQNFRVNSLTFEASSSTPASVLISPGADPLSRIEVSPQSSADGIRVLSAGPASVTIAAGVKIGRDQTWSVADSAGVLSLGSLFGSGVITVAGPGRVSLSAAADATFNGGGSAVFNVQSGVFELLSSAALGTAANGNAAAVSVSGGLFFVNNAAAGTFAGPLTLAGGAIAAAGASQTYSGPVTLASDSVVSARDRGVDLATARTVTLLGAISGPGRMTVNSVSTLSNGNVTAGSVVLSADNSSWSGGLEVLQGTVDLRHAAAVGTGPLVARQGRMLFKGAAGSVWTPFAAGLTLDNPGAGSVLELQPDNQGSGSVFTLELSGSVALGSATSSPSLRIYHADSLSATTLSGSVVLGASASIHASGAGTANYRPVTISGVISEAAPGTSLTLHGDSAWNSTNYQVIRLSGANTFTGDYVQPAGRVEFDTVTAAGGAASSLGRGNAISLGGTLAFVGSVSQSTNRPITSTANATLSAEGSAGATITYSGGITQTANQSLNLSGTGAGTISGSITQSGTAADLNVNAGTWSLTGSLTLADDVVVTGSSAELTFGSTSSLAFNVGTSNGLYARDGGRIIVAASALTGPANAGGLDFVLVGDQAASAPGFLEILPGAVLETPRLDLGGVQLTREGRIVAGGVLNVTGNATDYSTGIRLYRGEVAAALTGPASLLKQGADVVTLSGDNSGLTGTVATRLDSGTLTLDFTASNAAKIATNAVLDLRGVDVRLIGNASADSSQSVLSTTFANTSGLTRILLEPAAGRTLTLSLGAITRGAGAGTLRLINPSANGFLTTTTAAGAQGLLGAGGWATVQDAAGTWFATNDGAGNVVAQASVPSNDLTAWTPGAHVTDAAGGFSGQVDFANVGSLRFDAASGSVINLPQGGVLAIASGGILVTDQVLSGIPSVNGGYLSSAVNEVIFTHDSPRPFVLDAALAAGHALTKAGAGTLRLTGESTSTGAVRVQQGLVELVGGAAIGDRAVLELGDDRAAAVRLFASETIGGLQGGNNVDGMRDQALLDIGSHTLVVDTTGSSTSRTYSGKLSGSGTLVKAGTTANLALANESTGFGGAVVVDGGLFHLVNVGRIDATTITVNKTGALLLDNRGTTRTGQRILDTASIILNSADGSYAGETVLRGVMVRTDQNAATIETVGSIVFASGASYLSGDGDSSGTAVTGVTAGSFVRQERATFAARGRSLGTTSGERTLYRLVDASANEAAFIAALVGGAGAAGSRTVSIVPWAIGAVNSGSNGGLTDADTGNSFLTYVTAGGLRPLNLTTEFGTLADAGATNNARESLSAGLSAVPGRTVNSLIVNNAGQTAVALTGSGAGQALTVTSGALLFTLTGASAGSAYATTLGGFDDGLRVGGSEYVITVQNPSSAANAAALSVEISSPLPSDADITKSGRGTLVLSGVSTAGGGLRRTTVNEGVLLISGLDAIGGGTGELVFAGGTVRLAAGFADDLSSRTIRLLPGGGTVDTAGNDFLFASSAGSGLGSFTKAGAGTLTLSAPASYVGGTVVSGGTLALGVAGATGTVGDLTVNAGATYALAGFSATHRAVTTAGASPQITGPGTLAASSGFFLSHSGDTEITAVLAGSAGLLKSQNNAVTLSAANTFRGLTEVQNGTLVLTSVADVGVASSLGAPTTVETATIRLGAGGTAVGLRYQGSGHSTNRVVALTGTTGAVTLDASGTGALSLSEVAGFVPGTRTLRLVGAADSGLANTVVRIREGVSTINLLKDGDASWNITEPVAVGGAISVNNGVLRLAGGASAAGSLQFANANTLTTAGTLELLQSASFAGNLAVQQNSSALTARLDVAPGAVLSIGGNAIIGSGAGVLSTTLFEAVGGGSMSVTSSAAAAQFRVGGSNGAGNVTLADFTGLASLTVDYSDPGSIFRVNSTSGTNVTGTYAVMLAPDDLTVTAGRVTVGDGGQNNGGAGQVNRLVLGAGLTRFNVANLNVATGGRDHGRIHFAGADGSFVLRAQDGVGRANVSIGTGTANTGVASVSDNELLLAGHHADLLVDILAVGGQNRNQSKTDRLTFDTGLIDASSVILGDNGGTANGTASGTVATAVIEVGGGVFRTGAGGLEIGRGDTAVTGSDVIAATFTVTGGDVTFADSPALGAAVVMANNSVASNLTTNAVLSLLGGTVTVEGAIAKGLSTGAGSATVTLDGAVLDLGGHDVGSASGTVSLVAASGVLRSLGQYNGGTSVLTLGASGRTLTLEGAGGWTGGTLLTDGVLRLSDDASAGLGGLNLGGGLISSVGPAVRSLSNPLTISGDVAFGSGADSGSLTFTGDVGLGGQVRTLTVNVATALSGVVSSGGITKAGSGTLTLDGQNDFGGGLTVSAGVLRITDGSALGLGPVDVSAGATLDLGGQSVANVVNTVESATITNGSLPVESVSTVGVLDVVLTGTADLFKFSPGRLELTGASTYTGATFALAGTLAVDSLGDGAAASAIGITDVTNPAVLVLGSGATLEYKGAGEVTARSFTLVDSATLSIAAGAGALDFSASSSLALDPGYLSPTLRLHAENAVRNAFRSALAQADLDAGRAIRNLDVDGGEWLIDGSASRFAGDFRLDLLEGALAFTSGSLGGVGHSGVVEIASGARLLWEPGNSDDLSARLSVPAGATAALDVGANVVQFASSPAVGAGATVSKQGSGTLEISSSSLGSYAVNVASGRFIVNGSVGDVSVASGGTLGGGGTVGGISVASGGTVAPGNSPDTLYGISMTPAGGSIIDWEVRDALLGAGVGYDTIELTGNLDLSGASSADRVILRIVSLGAADARGGVPLNFNAGDARSFTLASVGGVILPVGVSNIADVFTLDLAGFQHTGGGAADAGLWSLSYDGAGLVTLAAVPEPSTYGFGLGALALAAAAVRRRRGRTGAA